MNAILLFFSFVAVVVGLLLIAAGLRAAAPRFKRRTFYSTSCDGYYGPLVLALLAINLSGCATFADMDHEEHERKMADLKLAGRVAEAESRCSKWMSELEDRVEKFILENVESAFEWDRPECENYKPEAQAKLCRRVPRGG